MSFFSLLLIALGLGMDAFSVALAVGSLNRNIFPWTFVRLSTSFGMFQFGMPILGWAGGMTVAGLISNYGHWIAFVLLLGIGIKMVIDSLKGQESERFGPDPTSGLSLLFLSVATSVDAFAVGLSFALIDIPILYPSCIIGIAAFAMTSAGLFLGRRLGKALGRRAGILGGIILIGIGFKVLLDAIL